MPSLSVHQQKAHKKQRKSRIDNTSSNKTHPDQLAAEEWLAAHNSLASHSPSPSAASSDSAASPSLSPPTDSLLSAALFSPSYIESARAAYSAALPFPHYTIRPLLDDTYCRHLLAVCKLLHFTHRRSDLYRFDQSEDLKSVDSPIISRLRSLLYGEPFRHLLESITGVRVSGSLDASVSISCAAYSNTHRLLCHDDELQGRRIAYILYLVPDDWTDEDGGHLDLFDSSQTSQSSATGGEEGGQQQPRPVPVSSATTDRSLLPAFNAFTFFEVTPRSFHAVREVTSERPQQQHSAGVPRVRVSISGWFHGEPVYPPSQPLNEEDHLNADQPLTCLPPLDKSALMRQLSSASSSSAVAAPLSPSAIDVLSLSHWLSADYCKAAVCWSVAAHFQAESSVELHNFLHPTRYRQLLSALQSLDSAASGAAVTERSAAGWRRSGPLNRRHYSAYPAAFRWTSDDVESRMTQRTTRVTEAAHTNTDSSSSDADSGGASTTSASAALLLLDQFSLFLRSSVFVDWLHSCTGGLCVSALRGEWRRFKCGDYTLALDDDAEQGMEALDVTLCLFDTDSVKQARQQQRSGSGDSKAVKGAKGRKRAAVTQVWDAEWGGSVHYIAAGAEDELLCSQPAANTLTLVYRAGSGSDGDQQQRHDDEKQMTTEEGDSGGCIRFTEYITHQCPTPRYDVDIICRLESSQEQ